MERRRRRALIALVAMLGCAVAGAPVLDAECAGTVRPPIPINGAFCGVAIDLSGAFLDGAMIELRDSSNAIAAEARADSHGRFMFRNIGPGVYRIAIDGFVPTSNAIEIIKPGAACEKRLQVDFTVVGDCGSHVRYEDGAVRILVDVEPLDRIFVDGYMRVPDNYGRHFLLLHMEEGTHRVELRGEKGYQPVEFTVAIRAHHTTTYRATLVREAQ